MNDQNEQWRPVVGYEGLYEISSAGQVRSLPRLTSTGNRRVPERLLKAEQNPRDKHWRVTLFGLDGPRKHFVHRLVLTAFVGECPNGHIGCHNNGDPNDNRLGNLRWDTHSANVQDAIRHGVQGQWRRTHCGKGHPLAGDNLGHDAAGRYCKTCKQARNRRAYLRRTAA